MSDPEEPWIEFLDEPDPLPAESASAPRYSRSARLSLGGVAGIALVVLIGTRIVHSDSAPPQRAQPAAVTSAQPTRGWVMYVPDGRQCADGPPAECDGNDVAIRDAVTEHLHLTVVAETTDFDPGSGIVDRHIEADNGRGTHLIVEIDRLGTYGSGVQAVSAGPGAAAVMAHVETAGFTVQLVAVGPKADVPPQAALTALGSDPRLLAA